MDKNEKQEEWNYLEFLQFYRNECQKKKLMSDAKTSDHFSTSELYSELARKKIKGYLNERNFLTEKKLERLKGLIHAEVDSASKKKIALTSVIPVAAILILLNAVVTFLFELAGNWNNILTILRWFVGFSIMYVVVAYFYKTSRFDFEASLIHDRGRFRFLAKIIDQILLEIT